MQGKLTSDLQYLPESRTISLGRSANSRLMIVWLKSQFLTRNELTEVSLPHCVRPYNRTSVTGRKILPLRTEISNCEAITTNEATIHCQRIMGATKSIGPNWQYHVNLSSVPNFEYSNDSIIDYMKLTRNEVINGLNIEPMNYSILQEMNFTSNEDMNISCFHFIGGIELGEHREYRIEDARDFTRKFPEEKCNILSFCYFSLSYKLSSLESINKKYSIDSNELYPHRVFLITYLVYIMFLIVYILFSIVYCCLLYSWLTCVNSSLTCVKGCIMFNHNIYGVIR